MADVMQTKNFSRTYLRHFIFSFANEKNIHHRFSMSGIICRRPTSSKAEDHSLE